MAVTGDTDALRATWLCEEQVPFSGWDFSHLDGRMHEDGPPWSYRAMCVAAMRHAGSVIDVDTGGGERMLELQEAWPPVVHATEAYLPNFRLAHRRLSAYGASVHHVRDPVHHPLPFEAGTFDLVLNRHGALPLKELARIVAPTGTLLTQQVDGRWCHDLMAVFGSRPQWPDNVLSVVTAQLHAQTDLTVADSGQWRGTIAFTDVAAVVYYLKAVPWLVPAFSVESHFDQLLELQRRLAATGRLQFYAGSFYILARRRRE